MEQSGVFREKSIQKVTSPEELNDYIKVASPSVWLVLASVLLLLAGITVWGVFGQLETAVNAAAISTGGTVTVYVTEQDAPQIREGQNVTVDGRVCKVASVAERPVAAAECLDGYALHCLNLNEDAWVLPVKLDSSLPDGTYSVRIVVDSVKPISFVIG